MAIKTISVPDKMLIEVVNRGISLSAATQTGIEVLSMGGIKEYQNVTQKLKDLEDSLEIKKIQLEDEKIKHENAKQIILEKNKEIVKLWAQIEELERKLNPNLIPEPKNDPENNNRDPIDEILETAIE